MLLGALKAIFLKGFQEWFSLFPYAFVLPDILEFIVKKSKKYKKIPENSLDRFQKSVYNLSWSEL